MIVPADLRLLIFAPLVGALAVMLAPARLGRGVAGAAAGVGLLCGLAAATADPAGLAVASPWLPGLGLSLALGVDGLAAPGVLVICLVGQVAALLGGSRAALAGGLALQAVLLAVVLARDLGLLVACHALLAPLVAGLVAGGSASGRWRAGGAAGLYLALGTAALALAIGLLAVAHHDASGGTWDLSLAALAQVLLPPGLEAAVAGLLLLAGALTLGLWPLHGWLVAAGAATPRGPALLIAGPVRWVGAYVLLRLWAPLAAGSAATAATGVATLAVLGGLVGAVCARAEADARRALLLATTVPAGLLVLGVAGQHHEGMVGAMIMAVVLALGGSAGLLALSAGAGRRLAGLALLPAPGLAGGVAAALVLIGTARFSLPTFGARAWPLALAAGVMLVVGIRALVDRPGPQGQGPEDRSPGTGERAALAGAAALALPLVVFGLWPSPWLLRLDGVGRGLADAAMLRRCLQIELGVRSSTRVPDPPIEACTQARLVVERAVRAAAAGEPTDAAPPEAG